jgi:hypothetical protein
MSKTWTSEEDAELLRLYSQYKDIKGKWNTIGKQIGKTSEACRMRWRYLQAKTPYDFDNASKVEYGDDTIYVVRASRRIMSQEELMEAYKINPNEWRVEKFIIRTSEGYRKDRQVSWHVHAGEVNGDVEDTGKMLVVPLYHMELRLIRKTEEIRSRNNIELMIEEAKKFAPHYLQFQYKKIKSEILYEIAMPDIHFGRLTWHEESGDDFDIKIAEQIVKSALLELLQYTANFEISKILLPIGNDFFNVNNKANTTVKGTPQQEDTRWQKTFRAGRKLVTEMIDTCTAIAPTDVLIISGNHDEEKVFYLGDALECWYHNSKNVKIDNNAKCRKYYDYGKILLGFTHGDAVTMKNLSYLMQYEVPQLWGNSLYREWHTGDKHHKSDFILEVDEQIGMIIRVLRSLVPADAWTFNKGLVGAQRTAEAFMWHSQNGLMAQFTAGINRK